MEGMCGSGDLIRIEPDPNKLPPGYVYAFLASRYGWACIRKLIFGGHIKHIEPKAVARIWTTFRARHCDYTLKSPTWR